MARAPIHPGEILADELSAIDMTGADLARAIGVPANRIYQILGGKRSLTAETALRLGRWFGTSPEFWLNLQKLYDLRLAEQDVGPEIERTVLPRMPAQAA